MAHPLADSEIDGPDFNPFLKVGTLPALEPTPFDLVGVLEEMREMYVVTETTSDATHVVLAYRCLIESVAKRIAGCDS